MIYAIKAVSTPFIKFGKANNVGRRLSELESASPFDLAILVMADWPDSAERTIHLLLKGFRQKGEWFRESAVTDLVIQCMKTPDAGLARLHQLAGKHRAKWADAVEKEDKIERRRNERTQWWAAQGA